MGLLNIINNITRKLGRTWAEFIQSLLNIINNITSKHKKAERIVRHVCLI